MRAFRLISIAAVCLLGIARAPQAQKLAKRESYNLPLMNLKVGEPEDGSVLRPVRITIKRREEYAQIAPFNDLHVEHTRSEIRKIEHAESPTTAFMISGFEAEQLSEVVKSFARQLEIFERDLKKGRWGRLLYLDAYFPRFLKSFYYLVCAARNSQYAMPQIGKIPESEFDVSLSSEKSDRRIARWRSKQEHVIKLRIISRELQFQLKKWMKRELENSRRNPEIAYSEKAEEAFGLFVRFYFDLAPPQQALQEEESL